MSTDLRNQCDWLASEGFLAAAPDLFEGKTFFSCMFRIIREFNKRQGKVFDDVEKVKEFLKNHPKSNGKTGVIGFCFGGGFAVILSCGYDFDVASVNYGGKIPEKNEHELEKACPIVGSYGALDRNCKGAAAQLERLLTQYEIDHDVKEYENTDHAFINNHVPNEVPLFIKIISFAFGGGEYNENSAIDAKKRIVSFFNKYLR
jgi:carboxymethylenebutenolidase